MCFLGNATRKKLKSKIPITLVAIDWFRVFQSIYLEILDQVVIRIVSIGALI
jgi:hypothetical protein